MELTYQEAKELDFDSLMEMAMNDKLITDAELKEFQFQTKTELRIRILNNFTDRYYPEGK